MRYFRSWLFDVGLVLIVASVVAVKLVQPGEVHKISEPTSGALKSNPEYSETNYTVPAVLALGGLAATVIATVRTKSRISS
jgi:hypothetical protein